MRTRQSGLVRPVCNQHSPRLGPMAIMAATTADFNALQRKLNLPENRSLFLGMLKFDASRPNGPALAGPLMGAPYAVMVLETLIAWGARTFVFVGWCGAIGKDLRTGAVLIPDSAVVDEGTSLHYAQSAGDIVTPHTRLRDELRSIFRQNAVDCLGARVWSTDGIFRETPGQIRKFQGMGAVAVEMEISALFSVARFYDVRLAAVLIVSDELSDMQWRPGFKSDAFKQSRDIVCNLIAKTYRT